MKTLMIAAIQSGAGKTVTVCALLAALKKRGLRLQAFKCGPDYIDPMFHARVLGVPSRNLDLFLQGKEGVKRTLSRAGADFALVEGAMGYYDGLNNSDEASAWALARLTGTPVVLVVSPKGSDLTLAAQIRGLMSFRPDSGIAALILASCPEARAASLSPVLERETGLPVLGFLPPMDEAHFESRHLGLMTAAEIGDLEARLEKLGDAAERYIDLDRLVGLAGRWETAQNTFFLRETAKQNVRVAAARDEAFCFTYADNLDALREAGAELVFFSPLHDAALPEADGLYLPGGYPELHARALSENTAMRQSIQAAIARGLPTVAECGGFLYLQELLEDAARLFNGLQVDVLSVHEARLSDLGHYHLVAVLQADALFPEGDFRADERAVQALAVIAEQCSGTFLVQTAKAEHPVFSNQEHIYRQLLSERRQFNLPPFSRLVQTLWGSRSELLTFAPDKMLGLRQQELWQRALAFEKKTKGRVRVIIDVDPI